MGAWRALLLVTFVFSAAACSSSPGARSLSLSFHDRVRSTSCPAGTPEGFGCFLLRSRTQAEGFGNVKTGPTLDVEAPQSSAACGRRITFLQRLRFADGALTARVSGPRFCLYRVGVVRRHFRVVGGTGAFADATGSGAVTVVIESVGAVEKWQGSVTLPHHG